MSQKRTVEQVAHSWGISPSALHKIVAELDDGKELRPQHGKRGRPAPEYDDKVRSFIDAFWRENNYSPSLREIMQSVGVPSSSHTAYIVRKLAKKGHVIYTEKISRGIVPVWVKQVLEAA